jgi:hypothetical protein
MQEWNKKKLLEKYPIRNDQFHQNYVIGYGDAYWYPGMPTQIVTFDETGKYDPWNREWEDGTAWQSYDAYKDVLFRWVTVDGKKIAIYCVIRS